MMSWFEARPAPSFEDRDGARTAALISSVSRFGIVAAKAGMSMSLHLGVGADEGHHIRSLPDVSSSPAGPGGPPAGLAPRRPRRGAGAGAGSKAVAEVAELRLRASFAVPLCASPAPCRLYAHSAELPDFVVGLAGRRVPYSVVAQRRAALARGGSARAASAAAGLGRLADAKLASGGPFFLCRIFASCPGGLGPLLSSVNFAHAASGPNSLVAGRPRLADCGEGGGGNGGTQLLRCPRLAEPPARLPLLAGRSTAPVLSPAEMASVLALPPTMFGLAVAPGADRTFTNAPTGMADPAAPFERTAEWGP